MVDRMRKKRIQQMTILVLGLVMAVTLMVPAFVCADDTEPAKGATVRVGWYDSSFNYKDQSNRRFGYAYDYQQKIAAYTGWKYVYVEGTWTELLEKLKQGKIDLMSDVSFTEERTESMLFSELPMGEEAYYMFVKAGNKEINPEDLKTFNGKSVGVNRNSIEIAFLKDWIKAHKLNMEIRELTVSKDEYKQMLLDGELDIFYTPDIQDDAGLFVPVSRIGSSNYYFAVNKDRPDLLEELNTAMNRIQEENRYYNEELFEKYFANTESKTFLTTGEKKWLVEHGPIRVGYRNDYLPFCTEDPSTGEMTGALSEILVQAAKDQPEVEFETVACPSAVDALEALKRGEVDCMFPAAFSATDGENGGYMMTDPVIQTEMYAVVRKAEHVRVLPQEGMTVALNSQNPNHSVFLANHYPKWKVVKAEGESACLKLVESGATDCTLVSRYRAFRRDDLHRNSSLETVMTGKTMPLSFAVRRSDDDLYGVLDKLTGHLPQPVVDAALEPYVYSEEKVSLVAVLKDYWVSILILIAAVFGLIVFLLYKRLAAERKAHERQKLIAVTELDPLTKLYNRAFFFEYADRMYRDNRTREMDAIVLDIDQFHSVNALNGRAFGDRVLRYLAEEIRCFAEENGGIAGRFEADHFDIYCGHTEDYPGLFDRFQNKLNEISRNANLRLRMGVMPWQEGVEPEQLFDQAAAACSRARSEYGPHMKVFDEEVQQRENYEQRLLFDMRRAIEEKEFLVYYQPKFYVQCEPPRLNSAEALIRWNHPELGMIPPADFIPLFEKNGIIGEVDRYVWTEVARQMAAWKEAYGVAMPVSVNLSRLDVYDPALESILEELVESNGLDRRDFKLEVTESAYTENADQVIAVISRLRGKGYEIEMDDFGSGYSSLNMLSTMPVDVLKMDRAFIHNIEHSVKDLRLVEMVLDIARNLKVPVIAEGVETEDQATLLKELGCDVIQGYYFSQPLPAEEFEKMIRESVRTGS